MNGNPLLKGMNNFNPQAMLIQQMLNNNPQLRNIYSMLQQGANPQAMMQNIMNNNPQAQQVLNNMKNSGMSAEQYVRNLARQYNVNIEPMIQSFRKRGYR